MNVVVVNSGVGNLGAIPNMLHRLGAAARVTDDKVEISSADRLILPGVGAFDAAMKRLDELGLIEVLRRKVLEEGTPILGVCLGMQLFGTGSEEGRLTGLGWIKGHAVRFRTDATERVLRVPHMGWNYVEPRADSSLFADMPVRPPRFYFAHSYHLVCEEPEDIAGISRYGYPFVAAVHRGNVSGIQFHPEKSHRFGLQVFRNFLSGLLDD